ncbi:MAG: trypsin-like peptidase domain-containing protein [Streptococcus orisratti]|uniref:S1C family serine protease n=1 Tax=Streptococcus orisratti TaxID=114652 RepID=UPI00235243F4|nr:trypsin-like peptidase domain-containing protein [Streptococcus orisratti]MCI7677182.1 trypsin-like peptidase domain-containing protein [Streptococcus orisratti]MDY4002285.1 trypsin-like peptidase domain-containing protein [Streptococcus orisratti]MDY5635971.1 trypsin-like peptidase domain-containing protein [Streptococcus orisratti]
MKKMKNWLKPVAAVIILFLAGLTGALVALNITNKSQTTVSSSSNVTTSSVSYKNSTSTTEAVKKVQEAVVSVINYQSQSSSLENNFSTQMFGDQSDSSSSDELSVYSEGSGVIYKIDGDSAYLVTNTHVIEGAKQIEIMLSDGTKVVGELVGEDTYSDIAVVKISSKNISTVAEFADSDKLTVGETAIAIGSPLGTEYANSVTQGIVSSLSRTVTLTNSNGETISTNAIQTDAAINPGNSGGALINVEGQVIGINSSKISSTSSQSGESVEGMGFAIPANDVVKIINQLEQNGEVVRPALGIRMAALSELSTNAISQLNIPSSITNGVVVAKVIDGMPAQGKLEKYDVITEIDGKEVTSSSDLQSILYGHSVNDSIKVTFYRGTEKKTTTIELTKTTKDLSDE